MEMDTQPLLINAMMLKYWMSTSAEPSYSKVPLTSSSHKLRSGWEKLPVSMMVVLQTYQTHMQLDSCNKLIYSLAHYSIIFSFRWLDKLGVAAVVGHKRVFRQDFVGGNYALLNETQDPLPVSGEVMTE